ncbi:hypothetical protein HOF92_05115 [bacterium]|jgi:sterol desaturase/sphingolipid hydroxylase (fatty acid hydroxylase superfamily)|nr:hypothetical protein [bacterium]
MLLDWTIHIVLCLVGGFLLTEIAGYFIHHLLHSNAIHWLSRYHMIHHLRDYGPGKSLRSEKYICSADGRASILDFGFEWVIPILTLLVGMEVVFGFFQAHMVTRVLFPAFCLIYGYFSFSMMHDAMHLKNWWMLKHPFLKKWFLAARRSHDLHHMIIADDGLMKFNFGISFYFIDKILGTFTKEGQSFNQKGYEQALKRYDYVL